MKTLREQKEELWAAVEEKRQAIYGLGEEMISEIDAAIASSNKKTTDADRLEELLEELSRSKQAIRWKLDELTTIYHG